MTDLATDFGRKIKARFDRGDAAQVRRASLLDVALLLQDVMKLDDQTRLLGLILQESWMDGWRQGKGEG